MNDARAQVATALRRLREARGLSLSELSRASGIAKATLSNLEAAQANPTLDTLWALANALHVSLGELLTPASPSMIVVRKGEGVPVQGTSVSAELIHQVDFDAVHLEIFAGQVALKRQVSPAHVPGTIEYLYVLRGKLRVGPVDGAVELATGDLLRMEASAPHLYEALGGSPAQILLLMAYPRERRGPGRSKP
jgi:transcriptional regulator with XRE-family HTH domain